MRKPPPFPTEETVSAFTTVENCQDPHGLSRFYVVGQTTTIRRLDTGKIYQQGTMYYAMDRTTGELYSDPKKGVIAYQNHTSCFMYCDKLCRTIKE